MRSIDVEEVDGTQRITLNGDQTLPAFHPRPGLLANGVYTAPTDEALAWDIQATKDLGFNTIRKRIKVEPQRWYLHADQIGMLVWQDMPTADNGDEDARNVFRAELTEMIEGVRIDHLDHRLPVPMNEEAGANGSRLRPARSPTTSRPRTRAVSSTAHSGVNCCNSKGDSGKGDIIDWHRVHRASPAAPRCHARCDRRGARWILTVRPGAHLAERIGEPVR